MSGKQAALGLHLIGGAMVVGLTMFVVKGCTDANGHCYLQPVPDTSRVSRVTPNGFVVGVPLMLAERKPELTDTLLGLVDTTPSQIDPRIPEVTSSHVGPPPGYVVQILQPGSFPTKASPTGFANGQVILRSREIYIPIKLDSRSADPPYMEALGHEYLHAWVHALGGSQQRIVCAGHSCAVE